MNIGNVDSFVESVRKAFPEYEFDLQWQGKDLKVGRPWARAFILIPDYSDGIPFSLGRINFQPVAEGGWKIYRVKQYKPSDIEYDPKDAFFYQFDLWVLTGERIDIDSLVEEAKALKLQKIAAIEQWRKEHPKEKKRARINRQWMPELRKMVQVKIEEIITTGASNGTV